MAFFSESSSEFIKHSLLARNSIHSNLSEIVHTNSILAELYENPFATMQKSVLKAMKNVQLSFPMCRKSISNMNTPIWKSNSMTCLISLSTVSNRIIIELLILIRWKQFLFLYKFYKRYKASEYNYLIPANKTILSKHEPNLLFIIVNNFLIIDFLFLKILPLHKTNHLGLKYILG